MILSMYDIYYRACRVAPEMFANSMFRLCLQTYSMKDYVLSDLEFTLKS